MGHDILITNIKGLVQVRDFTPSFLAGRAMADLPIIRDAYLLMENGTIKDYGPMSTLASDLRATHEINASGRFVFPSFVDSHTHIVFAASREEEFVMKIKGAHIRT